MRILIITDQLPPNQYGGMAQHAWHISHYFALNHDVLVLVQKDYKSKKKTYRLK
jgi:hypothetical protein